MRGLTAQRQNPHLRAIGNKTLETYYLDENQVEASGPRDIPVHVPAVPNRARGGAKLGANHSTQAEVDRDHLFGQRLKYSRRKPQ